MFRHRSFFVVIALFVPALSVTAQQSAQSALAQIDDLYQQGRQQESITRLREMLSDAAYATEQAEINWRLSRATLAQTDIALFENRISDEQAMEAFAQGEQYADAAISEDARRHEAYFWKAANMGKRGQLRGVLNSLFMADDMKELLVKAVELEPEYSEPYFVLGQLYDQLPGWPVSFGDDDAAVSLGRKSLDLQKREVVSGERPRPSYDYYVELARHLWERNWDVRKRNRQHEKHVTALSEAKTPLGRAFVYSGAVPLDRISDREEAQRVMRTAIDTLESLPQPTPREQKDLAKARKIEASWK